MRILVTAISIAILAAEVVADITMPPGHELLKQEGNYYTILNNTTHQVNIYYIEGQPTTTSWQVSRLLEDSIIFQQVYYLDAFFTAKAFVSDFNQNELPELFSAVVGDGLRTRFLENQGNFNLVGVYRLDRPLATWGYGDTDEDGLFEILGQKNDSLILIEQVQADSFPSCMIWSNADFGGAHISNAKIGDIYGRGRQDISFLNAAFDPWRIEIYEYTANNIFIQKPPIIWQSGGPADYTYADFDGDGNNEIVSSVAHTDIIIFEYVGNDSFAPVWQTDLGCPNPYQHEYIGDNNGNGYGEWVSCGRDFSRSGFFFKVFEATGDNQYQVVYYDSLPGDCWEDGGLTHGDIDNDGRNEFMVSANSNIGLYKYDSVRGWHLAWLCDEGGFATTYPYLLDVDSDGECEIAISGGLLRTRIYNRVYTYINQSLYNLEADYNIQLYPNPTNNMLRILVNGLAGFGKIKIYDISGRLVKTCPTGMNYNWDLRDNMGKEVTSGTYFIVYVINGYLLVKKALILH